VPGKLYGIMASGRPAIFIGPLASDTGETVAKHDVGIVVEPGDPKAPELIVETLVRWTQEPGELQALGARARYAFLHGFERTSQCEAFASVIALHLSRGES
jgi:hypothetical protein